MKTLRVAVLGGGTAGTMTAAHLTRHFPRFELYHIYDSGLPPIGVGEGTTPPVAAWLHETTGLGFAALQDACELTLKRGIRFEGWGTAADHYVHYFSPTREGTAYHFSAAGLVRLLRPYVTATSLDRRVTAIEHRGTSARIAFEQGDDLTADLVFDARGFPAPEERAASGVSLEGIPTNAALVARAPSPSPLDATRAIARPHGWIFVIPLRSSTSYGYVYNSAVSSRDDVRRDLEAFLAAEGVEAGPPRALTFPNFSRRTFFDGVVFRVGNAAAFLEPLEATGLTFLLVQLRLASYWILDEILEISKRGRSASCLATINGHLLGFVREAALFVSWHYACGSPHRTPFWAHARACFERDWAAASPQTRAAFSDSLRVGAALPPALAFEPGAAGLEPSPDTGQASTFGGFLDLSFAKVGHGIGYFEQLAAGRSSVAAASTA